MLWSPRKRRLSSRIKALSDQQRLLLAAACVDWSLSKLQGGFQTGRLKMKLPLVNEAMSCLWILARWRRFDADELQRLY
ncbi:MAG: hypothetical protein H8E66_33465 [Planctomycetes bacterium]|nr:hypothetical protein [Planctomycetota bacterium]